MILWLTAKSFSVTSKRKNTKTCRWKIRSAYKLKRKLFHYWSGFNAFPISLDEEEEEEEEPKWSNSGGIKDVVHWDSVILLCRFLVMLVYTVFQSSNNNNSWCLQQEQQHLVGKKKQRCSSSLRFCGSWKYSNLFTAWSLNENWLEGMDSEITEGVGGNDDPDDDDGNNN